MWESISEITFAVIGISFIGGLVFFARYSEKKKWNKGVCPDCGSTLVLNGWMIDSQGGRGWTCPKSGCDYTAWVSYNIDKKAVQGN